MQTGKRKYLQLPEENKMIVHLIKNKEKYYTMEKSAVSEEDENNKNINEAYASSHKQ